MSTRTHFQQRTGRPLLASAPFSGPIVSRSVWREGCLTAVGRGPLRFAFLICGVFALVALPVDAGEQLKIEVSPAQSFAPALLRVRVRIEPSADNRSLEVIADSGEFYRSSEIQLEGDRSEATIDLELRSVPQGDYRVVAILKDGSGHERSMVSQVVKVIGSEVTD